MGSCCDSLPFYHAFCLSAASFCVILKATLVQGPLAEHVTYIIIAKVCLVVVFD